MMDKIREILKNTWLEGNYTNVYEAVEMDVMNREVDQAHNAIIQAVKELAPKEEYCNCNRPDCFVTGYNAYRKELFKNLEGE